MKFWRIRHRSARRKQGPRPNLSRGHSRDYRRRWRWIRPVGKLVLGLILAGVAVWAGILGYQTAAPMVTTWLTVKDVMVSGHNQVPRAEVLDYLKLAPHATLLSVNPRHLAMRLEAHPWIKRADVKRVLPNALHVYIVERQAAAVLRSSAMTLLLDEEGHPLSVLSESTEPGLPILVGLNAKRLMSGERELIKVAQRGVEVAGMLARTFDGRPEVDVSNGENIVAYVQGLRLQFGGSSFEEKWALYRKLESHVTGTPNHPNTLNSLNHLNQGRADGRSDIDLRYPGKVIVRERG
ncbi:MAG TPA: FtsQ-type POTRA domain-containing protein [Nitrospiraceae bacterium]|nr:FtsQ-type POTRA domain-containing protein [Nitrospiraceae bacterium]